MGAALFLFILSRKGPYRQTMSFPVQFPFLNLNCYRFILVEFRFLDRFLSGKQHWNGYPRAQ